MPLKYRILLFIAGINVGVLVFVTWTGMETARAELDSGVLSEAMEAVQSVGQDELLSRVKASRYVRVVLRLARGAEKFEFATSMSEAELQEWEGPLEAVKRDLQDATRRGEPVFRYDSEMLALTIVDPSPRARWSQVYIGLTDAARHEALSPLQTTFVILSVGTVLLIVATFLMLSRVLFRPLAGMASAVRSVSEGRTPEPVQVAGKGEFARLAADFSAMSREVNAYQTRLEDRVRDALQRARAAETRLVVAQRLASTGTLAAGFAHEINNPLGGVMNAIHKLQAGTLSPERQDEYYELVLDGLNRIRTIVERILHFTPRVSEPRDVDMTEVAERALALVRHRADAREHAVDVRAEHEGPPVIVSGDAQELMQAVLNLVLNAIDAIPAERGGEVVVRTQVDGADALVAVTDDGVGMDDETRQRCVDLFYSSKPEGEGTGLGLAIVQHIVTDHGGTLDIASETGRGTTIQIRLPLSGGV